MKKKVFLKWKYMRWNVVPKISNKEHDKKATNGTWPTLTTWETPQRNLVYIGYVKLSIKVILLGIEDKKSHKVFFNYNFKGVPQNSHKMKHYLLSY